MAGEDNIKDQGGRKRSMNRKAMKKHKGPDEVGESTGNISGGGALAETFKAKGFSDHQEASASKRFIRKQVDPETAQYFSEIANVIEGTEFDSEERPWICGNALEETKGKEVELATDYYISHTLQMLLKGCTLEHLCDFLRRCSKDFPRISMDTSGSHVAESALESLASHIQDNETYSLVEETLTTICQAIVGNAVDVMCSCYGSHVLRSLLCLCKGVPLDSSEFHSKKSSAVLEAQKSTIHQSVYSKLAERLNSRQPDRTEFRNFQLGYPNLLKLLVSEMLEAARKDIATLQVDHYSSLVLQTALKLLVGCEQELLQIIPILLGSGSENSIEGNFIEINAVRRLLNLMRETAFSHLMEVILEVAPEALYNELIEKVFKGSLFEMSSHQCGNFVVQALVSHARNKDHLELIWKELGTRFKDLFSMGRSGVVASVLATSHRLHSHEHKCCLALAAAVCMENEASGCIVPRILFLNNYFGCKDTSNWNWPNGAKMHVIGSLILQAVFRFPSEFIHAYISSITSLEADHVLEAAKDSGGARVIEIFLSSNASGKQKRKLVVKLRGHFGELSVFQSGSFTVEKCFDVSNLSLKEEIVSELLPKQTELSKTKKGPHLLRKLDVEGYAKQPDRWKSRLVSRESAYKDFMATFGSKEIKSVKVDTFLSDAHPKPKQEKLQEKLKDMRKEIDTRLASAPTPSLVSQFLAHKPSTSKQKSGKKHHSKIAGWDPEKSTKRPLEDDSLKSKHKKKRKINDDTGN